MGVVLPQSWHGFKNFARNRTIGTPLQEILDPPLTHTDTHTHTYICIDAHVSNTFVSFSGPIPRLKHIETSGMENGNEAMYLIVYPQFSITWLHASLALHAASSVVK